MISTAWAPGTHTQKGTRYRHQLHRGYTLTSPSRRTGFFLVHHTPLGDTIHLGSGAASGQSARHNLSLTGFLSLSSLEWSSSADVPHLLFFPFGSVEDKEIPGRISRRCRLVALRAPGGSSATSEMSWDFLSMSARHVGTPTAADDTHHLVGVLY